MNPSRAACGPSEGRRLQDRQRARIRPRLLGIAFVLALTLLLLPALGGSPRPPRSDESVEFFPTQGHRVAGGWEIEVRGRLYEPERRRVTLAILSQLTGMALDPMTPAEKKLFAERASLFLGDNEHGERLRLRIGTHPFVSGKSERDGQFVGRVRLTDAEVATAARTDRGGRVVAVEIDDPKSASRTPAGWVELVEPQGVSIVSDIDDTLKVSNVRDRRVLLLNTFCRPFQVVPGMPELFQQWEKQPGTSFHYVSAAPWALHRPLAQFLTGFPPGSMHLKRVRLKDRTVLGLFEAPDAHKRAEIEGLLKRFPARGFILVGDSGERDPEIYGALARRHPTRIRRIHIRDVTGEHATAERYRRAFRDVPADKWSVFTDPKDIKVAVPTTP